MFRVLRKDLRIVWLSSLQFASFEGQRIPICNTVTYVNHDLKFEASEGMFKLEALGYKAASQILALSAQLLTPISQGILI